MLKKSARRAAAGHEAPDQPAATPDMPAPEQPAAGPDTPTPDQPAAARQTPATEYAALGPDAPIAWPTGARRVPVTGQLPPHATAALERMGITKSND